MTSGDTPQVNRTNRITSCHFCLFCYYNLDFTNLLICAQIENHFVTYFIWVQISLLKFAILIWDVSILISHKTTTQPIMTMSSSEGPGNTSVSNRNFRMKPIHLNGKAVINGFSGITEQPTCTADLWRPPFSSSTLSVARLNCARDQRERCF